MLESIEKRLGVGRGFLMTETAEELGFLAQLTPDDLNALKRFVDRHTEEYIRANAWLQKLSVASVGSELINETLTAITAKTGSSPEEAMEMALTLYDVAVDATRSGQRLVLVDQNYRFVREVTGIVKKSPETSSPEKVAG